MKPRSPRLRLEGSGIDVALAPGTYIVGRAAEAAVRIESSGVSRYHARIVFDGETATLEDLGSKNGTFIGKTKIERPSPLKDGDEVHLGRLAATLRVVVEDNTSQVTEKSNGLATDAVLSD